jgi:MraZ protein
MANLIGEYECKLDTKTRFLLPVGLKKQLDPAAQETFVLNRGFEGCLVLYPMNEWEKETARMSKLNLFVTRNRKFYRQFHNGATQLSLDSNGRVLIPKNLLGYADVKKDIVLFAYANRIEIWSKSKYEQMMSEDLEQFADLAEDVMGELNQDDNN